MFKIIVDAGLIVVSFILAYFFRFKVLVFITPGSAPIFQQYLNVLIFIILVWLTIFNFIGLYNRKKFTSLIDELAILFGGVILSAMVLLGFLFLNREFWFSRLVVFYQESAAALWLGYQKYAYFRRRRDGPAIGAQDYTGEDSWRQGGRVFR